MFKKQWMKIVIIGIVLFSLLSPAYVTAKSVSDCLDGTNDCQELEEDDEESTDEPEPIAKNETGSLFLNILKTVFALILILGLIYGMVKVLGKRNQLGQQTKALENLGGISVGPNKSVQMVRVGQKIFLLGVGENIELLDEITDERIKQDLLRDDDTGSNQEQLFSSIFNRFQRHNKSDESNSHHFKQLFTEELKKLKFNRKKVINTQQKKDDNYE